MKTLKTIRAFYLFYTLYTLYILLISDYTPLYALLGLLALWGGYLAFSAGMRSGGAAPSPAGREARRGGVPFGGVAGWKAPARWASGILCWLCSGAAAKFYTGRGPLRVISGLFSGEGAYQIYQAHVAEQSIGRFSWGKVPYILMLTYLTMMLLWVSAGILLETARPSPGQKLYLASVVLSNLYFGAARGTNFEMYIVLITAAYCLLNRPGRAGKDRLDRRVVLLVILLGAAAVLVFRSVVAARGMVFACRLCSDIQYLPGRFVSRTFPTLTNIAASVFGYVGFGIYAMGRVYGACFLASARGMLLAGLPMGFALAEGRTVEDITRTLVDVGVGWVPDHLVLVNWLGVPLLLLALHWCGRRLAALRRSDAPELLKDLAGILVYIEMLSLPVGNFLLTSTPNTLTLLVVLLCLAGHRRRVRLTVGKRRS